MIPREIDDLMWTIAEGKDPAAIDEFGDRYPTLREELLKRIRTINALKSGNRTLKASKVPTFQNTRVQTTNKNLVWASLAFALIAIFSFGVYYLNNHISPSTAITPINLQPAKLPDTNIQPQNQSNLEAMNVPTNRNSTSQSSPPNFPLTSKQSPGETETLGSVKTLKLESAPLQTAILLIAESGHFTVTIAPGMANPTVKIDFENMEPLEMLKELGNQYAFTPVIDGQRAILIIPKKDEDEGIISGNR